MKTQRRAIVINGETWDVIICGKGKKTVVIFPNILLFPEEWNFYIKQLSSSYRIIIPMYPPVSSYDEMLSGLTQVLKQLKVTKFVLIGNSVGGMLAQGYTKRYPKEVSKIILIATISPNRLYGFLTHILCIVGYVLPTSFIQAFAYWHTKISLFPSKENTALLPKLKKHIFANLPKDHFLALGKCIVDFCWSNDVVPHAIPFTIIEATGDVVFSFLFRNLSAIYPYATHFNIKNGLHLVEVNKKKEIIKIIKSLLK